MVANTRPHSFGPSARFYLVLSTARMHFTFVFFVRAVDCIKSDETDHFYLFTLFTIFMIMIMTLIIITNVLVIIIIILITSLCSMPSLFRLTSLFWNLISRSFSAKCMFLLWRNHPELSFDSSSNGHKTVDRSCKYSK